MKVLVTGAGGYIGSVLVPILLERGYEVRALDRFFFGRDALPPMPSLELVREDVRRIAPQHLAGIDSVVDLAALSNDSSGELFEESTWQINYQARARIARLAKETGVKRYILPSSCSIYGYRSPEVIVDEESKTHPMTTYAKANEKAEQATRKLADDKFCVVILRQATVYGVSPRMRFDLAINGMTYGAWESGVLPLMRDGTQWRPMLHVRDAARAICFMLEKEAEAVTGQIFNVGSDRNNYQLGALAEIVASTFDKPIKIAWYGDPDTRSYRVSFAKIENLGYRAEFEARDGVQEIRHALDAGKLDKTTNTITLDWYKKLVKWHQTIKEVEMYGGIIDI